jgi:hypothetical protein
MPGAQELAPQVAAALGDEDGEEGAQPEAAFALEFQLRDSIAQNLAAIPVEGRRLKCSRPRRRTSIMHVD